MKNEENMYDKSKEIYKTGVLNGLTSALAFLIVLLGLQMLYTGITSEPTNYKALFYIMALGFVATKVSLGIGDSLLEFVATSLEQSKKELDK